MRAIEMPRPERRKRMHALRKRVRDYDVARWSDSFLRTLAEARRGSEAFDGTDALGELEWTVERAPRSRS
jgi:trehalose 6-phosphate synthase